MVIKNTTKNLFKKIKKIYCIIQLEKESEETKKVILSNCKGF